MASVFKYGKWEVKPMLPIGYGVQRSRYCEGTKVLGHEILKTSGRIFLANTYAKAQEKADEENKRIERNL